MEQFHTMRPWREPSAWQAKFAGVTYVPAKGDEPNAFHRFMQHLAFGVKWERR